MIAVQTPLLNIPFLDADDMHILQSFHHIGELVNDDGAFQGYHFWDVSVAENIMREAYCKSVLGYMFSKQPISPEIFRLAFYFYGRLRLAKAVAKRMINSSGKEGEAKTKRTSNPDKIYIVWKIVAPIQ